MRIAILGYGTEGKSVYRFLKRSKKNKYKNASIEILDEKRDKNYLKHLNDFDLVVHPVSPIFDPKFKRLSKTVFNFLPLPKFSLTNLRESSSVSREVKGKVQPQPLYTKGLRFATRTSTWPEILASLLLIYCQN
jgi:hypothetical protein